MLKICPKCFHKIFAYYSYALQCFYHATIATDRHTGVVFLMRTDYIDHQYVWHLAKSVTEVM